MKRLIQNHTKVPILVQQTKEVPKLITVQAHQGQVKEDLIKGLQYKVLDQLKFKWDVLDHEMYKGKKRAMLRMIIILEMNMVKSKITIPIKYNSHEEVIMGEKTSIKTIIVLIKKISIHQKRKRRKEFKKNLNSEVVIILLKCWTLLK